MLLCVYIYIYIHFLTQENVDIPFTFDVKLTLETYVGQQDLHSSFNLVFQFSF